MGKRKKISPRPQGSEFASWFVSCAGQSGLYEFDCPNQALASMPAEAEVRMVRGGVSFNEPYDLCRIDLKPFERFDDDLAIIADNARREVKEAYRYELEWLQRDFHVLRYDIARQADAAVQRLARHFKGGADGNAA